MYCSNCGNKVTPELNYCNRCGGKMQKHENPNESLAKSLSTSLGYIGFAGFLSLVGIIAILTKDRWFEPAALVLIVGLFLTTLFGISGMILKQIFKLSENNKTTTNTPETNFQPAELNPPTTNKLQAPTEAPASVVENTTKTLDEVMVERK